MLIYQSGIADGLGESVAGSHIRMAVTSLSNPQDHQRASWFLISRIREEVDCNISEASFAGAKLELASRLGIVDNWLSSIPGTLDYRLEDLRYVNIEITLCDPFCGRSPLSEAAFPIKTFRQLPGGAGFLIAMPLTYSTFGNCGHRAPHGLFIFPARFFAQSAVTSSSQPISWHRDQDACF
jgi:hypothetical protein